MADEQTKKEPERPRVKASRGRDVKKRKFALLEVETGTWFRVRRHVDLPTLFIRNVLPLPLLSAVERLQEMRRNWNDDRPQDALGNLSTEDKQVFLDLLRNLAVQTVVTPTLTMSKMESVANEDVLWVGGYSDVPGERIEDLQSKWIRPQEEDGDVGPGAMMMIYRFVLGEAGLSIMPDDVADDFRSSDATEVDHVGAGRGTVRTEAVVVDSPAGDHGDPSVVPPTVDEPKIVQFLPIG